MHHTWHPKRCSGSVPENLPEEIFVSSGSGVTDSTRGCQEGALGGGKIVHHSAPDTPAANLVYPAGGGPEGVRCGGRFTPQSRPGRAALTGNDLLETQR